MIWDEKGGIGISEVDGVQWKLFFYRLPGEQLHCLAYAAVMKNGAPVLSEVSFILTEEELFRNGESEDFVVQKNIRRQLDGYWLSREQDENLI